MKARSGRMGSWMAAGAAVAASSSFTAPPTHGTVRANAAEGNPTGGSDADDGVLHLKPS
jgi:hypothetical protein